MSPNLEQVAQAFAQWRSTRTHRTQTPAELVEQAVALVEHHPKSIIVAKLGINARALKRWMIKPNNKGEANAFIEINNKQSTLALLNDSALALDVTATMPCGTAFRFAADTTRLASLMTSLQGRTNS